MRKPPHVIDIFLKPGECYFGDRDTRIRTLLGSCVAITLWHPRLLIGGMCHYMLPGRRRSGNEPFDARYADEALQLLLREIARSGTRVREYEVKMFGGGNMFPGADSCRKDHVGRKNVEAGRGLVRGHGMRHVGEDLDGTGYRNVMFDIWSGHVWVKRSMPPETPGQCIACEGGTACRRAA